MVAAELPRAGWGVAGGRGKVLPKGPCCREKERGRERDAWGCWIKNRRLRLKDTSSGHLSGNGLRERRFHIRENSKGEGKAAAGLEVGWAAAAGARERASAHVGEGGG